jgi:peptidoglycan/LPS O-acetylase OafA/YrhL
MSGLTILGYVLMALGVIVSIGGGIIKPIDLMNSEFMSFLTGGLILITIGLALIKNVPQWLLLATLWITAVSIIVYMYGFHMPVWVFVSGIVVTLGMGIWLTTLIL